MSCGHLRLYESKGLVGTRDQFQEIAGGCLFCWLNNQISCDHSDEYQLGWDDAMKKVLEHLGVKPK